VVLDLARSNPFYNPAAARRWLALVERNPDADCFQRTPGTVAPQEQAYGSYAQALAEMIREGGLEPVTSSTGCGCGSRHDRGVQVPLASVELQASFVFSIGRRMRRPPFHPRTRIRSGRSRSATSTPDAYSRAQPRHFARE